MENLSKKFFRPDIFFYEFKKHLGFRMEPQIEKVFSSIRDYLNSDDAALLKERLCPREEGKRDWFRELQNSIGYCQSQLGSVIYHFENLRRYEKDAIDIIQKHKPLKSAPLGQAMALSAEKLDYEFQAFSIGLKTYISMVAMTVFAFFKIENHTFNGFEKNFYRKHPTEISQRISTLLTEQWAKLSMFYSIEDRKSVRDMMVHYKYVGAGWINIYAGEEDSGLVAGMAMPTEIIRNETLQPAFQPHLVENIGLGTTRLVQEQLSFIVTLSFELFNVLGIYNRTAEQGA